MRALDLWIDTRNALSEACAALGCRLFGHDYQYIGPANEPWWFCCRCGRELL